MTETPAPSESTSATTQNTAGQQTPAEHMIPKSRLDEVLAREKVAREELERIKAAQAAADEEAAKAAGKFQELAEKRSMDLANIKPQLEAVTAERDRYMSVLTDHVKSLREGLSTEINELLDNLAPDKQLGWITKNRDKLSQRTNGVPATPRSSGGPSHEDMVEENKRKLQATGAYNPF